MQEAAYLLDKHRCKIIYRAVFVDLLFKSKKGPPDSLEPVSVSVFIH